MRNGVVTHYWMGLVPVLVGAMLLLGGCAGVHLQDKAQMVTATEAKDEYAKAKVEEVIQDEYKNLKSQLAAELEIVRANYQLRLDYAFLDMADNDTAPMADTWTNRASGRLTALGLPGDATRNQAEAIREYLNQKVRLRSARRRLDDRSALIFQVTGRHPPACEADLPANLTAPDGLSQEATTMAEVHYNTYVKVCKESLEEENKLIKGGEISTAYRNWQDALQRQRDLDTTIGALTAEVTQAKREHEQAQRQADSGGGEVEQTIEEAAENLTATLAKVQKVDERLSLGILPAERIAALTSILLAVASKPSDVDKIDDKNLKTAVIIAGQIPSLAGQIAALQGRAAAPSVSALLIEMQRQAILLEYAKEQQEMVQQRAVLHEAQYKAFEDEASQWLSFHDAMCSYAGIVATETHPGSACKTFVLTTRDTSVSCRLGGEPLQECALAKTWKATLATPPSNRLAKRELYKALAAFSLAMASRAPQDEYEYRLVDLDHQEIVAANRSAIRSWDSLVKVPIDQIAAYHDAGIPPERIAELIITGLSLGAIAVGVNR